MELTGRSIRETDLRQRGAALVTVVLVSFLLGTACIAMLTALGASSKNNSDALSEAKAYYAAESGLQATINTLRNSGVNYTYKDAVLDSAFAGTTQVNVGSETGYSILVTDPDNSSGAISYSTVGTFDQGNNTYNPTRVFGTGGNTLTFSFNNQGSVIATHPVNDGQPFGSFQVIKAGTGATMTELKFRIDYVMSAPRAATRTIRGSICTDGKIVFLPKVCPGPQTEQPTATLMGSTITLCNSNIGCAIPTLDMQTSTLQAGTPRTASLYGKMTAIEPYRLLVAATGYGPGSSTKKLEAIVQRNFFNDLGSSAAISMIGPNAFFQVGTSAQMQINGGSNPSITVSDQAGLNTINGVHTNGTMTPPPEIAGNDVPDWQSSPAAMDQFINQLKQAAQNSGRYFNGTAPTSFGDFTTGTGITFCDGSCNMGGNTQGGGILVVTGTFTTSGNPKFNGLVLAVGRYVSSSNPGGVVRSGGGNEVFTGNIVIAPYNPADLAAGWEQPRYDQQGGPGDTINSDIAVDQAFDGTSAITDFILGIAEK